MFFASLVLHALDTRFLSMWPLILCAISIDLAAVAAHLLIDFLTAHIISRGTDRRIFSLSLFVSAQLLRAWMNLLYLDVVLSLYRLCCLSSSVCCRHCLCAGIR